MLCDLSLSCLISVPRVLISSSSHTFVRESCSRVLHRDSGRVTEEGAMQKRGGLARCAKRRGRDG